MIELLILSLINLSFSVIFTALIGFSLWKFYPLIKFALGFAEVSETSLEDFASQGGVSSGAKRGEKKLLGQIIRRTLTDASGGISDIALSLIPDLDDWLERNPYAVLRLFQNPAIQKILAQFMGQVSQQQGVTDGTQTKETWW